MFSVHWKETAIRNTWEQIKAQMSLLSQYLWDIYGTVFVIIEGDKRLSSYWKLFNIQFAQKNASVSFLKVWKALTKML